MTFFNDDAEDPDSVLLISQLREALLYASPFNQEYIKIIYGIDKTMTRARHRTNVYIVCTLSIVLRERLN